MTLGSLTIVGTGIRALSHLTNETRIHMERADVLFYLVADPLTLDWIKCTFQDSISLKKHYVEGVPRIKSYQAMVDEVMTSVRDGLNVCCAFYGHPSIFVYPSHEMIKQCKDLNINYEMCPGISADACLYADLSIDPAKNGLMSYEATDFLVFDRPFSNYCGLVLWQIGVIGDLSYHEERDARRGLAFLSTRLKDAYSDGHTAVLYEAASIPVMPPRIIRTTIKKLPEETVSAITTLYIPPEHLAQINISAVESLGLNLERLHSDSTAFSRNR